LVKHLIASNKNVDVDEKDDDERTPLAYTAEGGHGEVVRLLLETGKIDVNSSDWEGLTPLYVDIEVKHDA
jgi:ankyrin repeat protein